MSKRAQRRHHRDRLIARTRRIRRRWWNSYEPDQSEWVQGEGRVFVSRKPDHSKADTDAVHRFNHLKDCSCVAYGCGNRRRCGGYQGPVLTRQERLAELHLREEVQHLRLERGKDSGDERA